MSKKTLLPTAIALSILTTSCSQILMVTPPTKQQPTRAEGHKIGTRFETLKETYTRLIISGEITENYFITHEPLNRPSQIVIPPGSIIKLTSAKQAGSYNNGYYTKLFGTVAPPNGNSIKNVYIRDLFDKQIPTQPGSKYLGNYLKEL